VRAQPLARPHSVSGSALWVALIALAGAGFSLGTDTYMLPALLPSLAGDLRVTIPIAAQTLTVYALTVALGAPLLTVLARRIERKVLLALCLGVLAGANLAAALVPAFGWLVLTRILAAVAAATLAPVRTTTAGMIAPPDRRARAISIATAGQTAALVVGGPFGAWIAAVFSWRLAFAAAGCVALVALLGVLAFVPRVPGGARASLSGQLAALRNPAVIVGLAATTAALCGIFDLFTYLRLVLAQATVLPAVAVGLMFGVYGVAGFAGTACAGWIADRWGTVQAMAAGLGLAALALLGMSMIYLLGQSPLNSALVPLLIALWGFGVWGFYSVQYNRLMELSPGEPTLTVAWNSPATFLGVSLGASLGGLIVHYASPALLGVASSGFMVLAAGCVTATVLFSRPAPATPLPGPGFRQASSFRGEP
jgi:predicted MFS family arabinose efflux permease